MGSARLENVAPGSRINITSAEVVTFSISDWTVGNLVFSYDGTVAGAAHTFANKASAAAVIAAISSIKDAKGASKITVLCPTATQTSIVVTMPAGADGSKLELVPTSATDTAGALPALVTKSVAKNNNGRSFKVVRVEQQEFPLGDPGGTEAETTLEYATASKAALIAGDEVTISRTAAGTPCQYLEGATDKSDDDGQSRIVSTVAYAATPTVIYTVGAAFPGKVKAGCTFSAYRTVLVVDSMPDTMSAAGTGGNIEMDIYGPNDPAP